MGLDRSLFVEGTAVKSGMWGTRVRLRSCPILAFSIRVFGKEAWVRTGDGICIYLRHLSGSINTCFVLYVLYIHTVLSSTYLIMG